MVCTAYGPPGVLQFQEADKPVPRGNEVQLRVRASIGGPRAETSSLLWHQLNISHLLSLSKGAGDAVFILVGGGHGGGVLLVTGD